MIWNEERKELARQCCRDWEGTPHRNRIAVKGEGVDCVRFVLEVLVASGIIDRPALPRYDERLGLLRQNNILEGILTDYLNAVPRRPDFPMFGDLVVCKVGLQSNHIGILIDEVMWHCPGKGAVSPEQWAEWEPRTQSLVRLYDIGYRVPPDLTWEEIRNRLPQ